ncbi:hypothetical protein SOV_22680 [Sporomusa ovata DSM 2662]|uniref:PUA-PAPS reductase like fusion n=1 Tax=Sporomusa ovata TaxID=2378 RepID=A0A0U1L3A6_9FIRM|nr:phosphoadenosine phosphosulfate reductase family protein [Sporomusa ovata]EQB25584.1 3'-phosphoadenosine 5'-phosphosulfate sulfotransferase (PAPS reductase)/FAD synthetase [Sporomusa ovata DSM 2662]CQR74140.1 PUA-PAPS reductase like fusion [Sporomusa ovata]
MLVENTLFGVRNKIQIAIDRIRQFEPPEGYYVAFSGGKDSIVVLDLLKRAGVKYDAHYNLTTVDPPELVQFIRETYKVKGRKVRYRQRLRAAKLTGNKLPRHWLEIKVHRPRRTMWELIAHKGFPPTRKIRYCCAEVKESGGKGRVVVTGVRWAESVRRSKRKMVEQCYNDNSKRYFHPIIDWSNEDVWEYIELRKLPYCSLYDEGQKRIGCVMCPMGNTVGMLEDAKRWPKIAQAYINAFEKACKRNRERGRESGQANGKEMFDWWVSGKAETKENPDQTVMFE